MSIHPFLAGHVDHPVAHSPDSFLPPQKDLDQALKKASTIHLCRLVVNAPSEIVEVGMEKGMEDSMDLISTLKLSWRNGIATIALARREVRAVVKHGHCTTNAG